MFGRQELLHAQRAAEERRTQANQEALEKQLSRRQAFLGETMVRATISRIDARHNGAEFKPAPRNRKNEEDFKRRLVLGEDFAVQNLSLSASGDRTSGWMLYRLLYKDKAPDKLMSFTAGRGGGEELFKAETHIVLWTGEGEGHAVEFNGPEYHFIRSVGGLFLPEVIETLEAEGL